MEHLLFHNTQHSILYLRRKSHMFDIKLGTHHIVFFSPQKRGENKNKKEI